MELSKNNSINILTVAAGDHVTFFELSTVVEGDGNGNDSVSVNSKLLHKHKMPIHFRNEGGASLHPSMKKFVAGGSDLWVRVFDFASGEELECNKGHHGPIRCLRYASNGLTYATGSEDGTIRLWKTDP
jgi:serine-threonine kinase receptor-associated protein